MIPEELAQNFVRQFDKLNNDNKSRCLNEIARVFKQKYPVGLWVEVVEDVDTDNYEFITFDFSVDKTDVKFIWDC